MSHQALARKWRPRSFDEVIGQDHVVSALTNALDSQRVHHAFLFTGTRGVGKTTLARIFARAVNCENGISSTPCGQCIACVGVDQGNYIDLIEVDAASRTKVDDTRELLENVQYAPTQGRFKIYLIDEVHMLSTHSFNALLKTLEEPPSHVKFLLATTDPQKLPATILSRCIQFNLKAMDLEHLNGQMDKILHSEGIAFDAEALMILARSADGSVRDALSLLDQAIAYGNGEVRSDQVRSMLGMIDDIFTHQIIEQICTEETAGLLDTVTSMAERSVSYSAALDEILGTLHNIALYQVSPQAVEWKGIDSATIAPLSEIADAELLQLLYQIALIGKRDLMLAPDPRTGFEMILLRMAAFQPVGSGKPPQQTATTVRPPENRFDIRSEPEKAPAPDGKVNSKPDSRTAEISTDIAPISNLASPRDINGRSKAGLTPVIAPAPETGEVNLSGTMKTGTDKGKTDDIATMKAVTKDYSIAESTDKLVGKNLASQQGWAEFIEHSGPEGLAKELMMNMAPVSFRDNTLEVVLNEDSRHLFNNGRMKKIEQFCVGRLGKDFRLKVEIEQLAEGQPETPSQQKQRESRQRQQSANQAFTHDPNVQELVDLFDAEIVTDSIRPPAT